MWMPSKTKTRCSAPTCCKFWLRTCNRIKRFKKKNKMPLKTLDPLVTQSKKLSLKFDEVQNITWFVIFTRAAVLQYFGSKTNVVKHQHLTYQLLY